ncbi:MAG TPA: hypothetical protein VLT36_13510, partial [Candidatus Dormibacteraeota bacterium]|nr:hypothetical protein [Candidatus Dormibacteraeota bacterium]
MTIRTLIRRSLRFHARSHLGVLIGATIGSAALIGALAVGDSVRETLRERALARLGWVHFAMPPQDRFFSTELEKDFLQLPLLSHSKAAGILQLPGTAARQDGSARANHVNIFGVS